MMRSTQFASDAHVLLVIMFVLTGSAPDIAYLRDYWLEAIQVYGFDRWRIRHGRAVDDGFANCPLSTQKWSQRQQ